jgi:hypothetical protein
MSCTLIVGVLALLAWGVPGSSQKDPDPLVKRIDLGPLSPFFDLIDAQTVGPRRLGPAPVTEGEAPPAQRLILNLKAKKDVDTSTLNVKIGSFDKADTLLRAVPLRFGEGFPLHKGESVRVACDVLHPPEVQGKLVIREPGKQTPKKDKAMPEEK